MPDSKPVKLAVVIPHYNTPAFLEETLRSVLACPEPAWVIVVDDGSADTEAVRAVINRVADADYSRELPPDLHGTFQLGDLSPKIEYVTERRRLHVNFAPHRNQYAAMNQGILAALALGVTHIAFRDADDTVYPLGFAHQLTALNRDPDRLAVGGEMSEMTADGTPVRGDAPMAVMYEDPVLAGVSRFGITLWPATATFKAEVFQLLGGFASVPTLGDTDFSTRLCFWCKLMGKKLLNLPLPVIRRRVHPKQVQANVGGPKSAFRAAFAEFLRQQHILFSTLVRIGAFDPLLLYRTLECPTPLPQTTPPLVATSSP